MTSSGEQVAGTGAVAHIPWVRYPYPVEMLVIGRGQALHTQLGSRCNAVVSRYQALHDRLIEKKYHWSSGVK